MSEETKDAPNEVAQDPVAPPMPTSDSAGSAPGSSADLSPILERLDKIESSLDDKIDARFKSGQDRNVYKIERELADLRGIVTAAGGDFDKVETDLRIGALTREVEGLRGGQQVAAPGRAGLSPEWVAAQAETEIILDGAGIDHSDPGYIAFAQRYAGRVKAADWPNLVRQFSVKHKKQSQDQPGAAFSGGTSPPSDSTPDELKAQYAKELASIPRGRVQDVAALKLKYRRMGVDV